jgi:opacity protein-like surface antigen
VPGGAALLLLFLGTLAPQQTEQPAPPPQDTRTQYPALLVNSYVGATLGYIGYDFSRRQLEPGFEAQAIDVPHAAARVTLFGHEFNRLLSAQLTYMRPVVYVSYRNVNGDAIRHRLFAHYGAVTVKPQLPLTRRTAVYAEAGLGVTSRRQITVEDRAAVRKAHFASALFGGGIDYHLTPTWTVSAGLTYLPGRATDTQPRTMLWSGGVQYTMRPLPQAVVEANRQTDAIFPAHLVQLEYTTGVGYGVNDFVSKRVPIFWAGNVNVNHGVAVHYQQNVFHTRRLFALDVGASASAWRSQTDGDGFGTLSGYPLLRFTIVRASAADFFIAYSLAGPTFISKVVIDGRDTGSHFTFQDFIAIGAFVGPSRHVTVGMKINHYSNGNIFTSNAGVKVPLTVNLGYAF